jgi:hypothetical protein
MKKSLINITLISALAINLSGCFEESVSCSAEEVKGILKEIVLPETKESMIAQLLNEKSPISGTLYLSMKKLGDIYGTNSKLSEMQGLETLTEIQKKVENEYTNVIFSLDDIRTLLKDKELNKVECIGKVTIKTNNYELIYDVGYNAQLGDDKKKIFVEVSSLE